jgi:uncharacterized membrane protein
MQTTETTRSYGVVRSADRHVPTGLQPSAEQRVNVAPKERVASALAGGLALAWGLSTGSWGAKAVAALGTGLIFRGVSGHCPLYRSLGVHGAGGADAAHYSDVRRARSSYDILRSATVQKSAEQVYRAFRDPQMFASALSHFAQLTPLAPGHMRWTLHDPLGQPHHWETEIVEDEPNRRLRWVTSEHSSLIKNLTLTLAPAPGDRGTEMQLHLRLERPTGALGTLVTKLLGAMPAWVVDRALGNIKSLLEAGELPTLKKNPSARASAQQ